MSPGTLRSAGSVVLDEKNIAQSQVSATIDVNSVDTRVEMRDKDLKSPNFFDVEKYPTMELNPRRSSPVREAAVIGDLTIHGTTHEVTLDVEGPSPEMTDPWVIRDVDFPRRRPSTARISTFSTTTPSKPERR